MAYRGIGVGFLLLCLSAGSSVACGSDGDGDGGVAQNKKMSELTQAEATQLCKDHQAEFDSVIDAACRAQGFLKADKAACEAERTSCLQTSPPGVDCAATDVTDLQGCNLTVSVVGSCLSEIKAWSDKIICDKLGENSLLTPPTCLQNLRDNCPLFAG